MGTRSRIVLAVVLGALGCRSVPKPMPPWTPTADADFRARAPAAEPGRPLLHAPDVERAELENGMTILVVERPELPSATVSYVNRAARDIDSSGSGMAGLSSLTLEAITRRTTVKPGEEQG
jgi:hypothetical protein